MKKTLVVMSAVLIASVASAQDAKQPAPAVAKAPAHTAKTATPPSKTAALAKVAEMGGEIVSVDVAKKTLTFKNEKGESLTWPAEGKALSGLKSAKAGEKVTVVYRANEKGEPQAATEIKAIPAAKVSDAKAPVAEAKPVATEKK